MYLRLLKISLFLIAAIGSIAVAFSSIAVTFNQEAIFALLYFCWYNVRGAIFAAVIAAVIVVVFSLITKEIYGWFEPSTRGHGTRRRASM